MLLCPTQVYIHKIYVNEGVSECGLKHFSEDLESNPYLLPSIPSELLPLLQTLHDKGQVILLKNDQDISNSWVITNFAALLETVVGSILPHVTFHSTLHLAALELFQSPESVKPFLTSTQTF